MLQGKLFYTIVGAPEAINLANSFRFPSLASDTRKLWAHTRARAEPCDRPSCGMRISHRGRCLRRALPKEAARDSRRGAPNATAARTMAQRRCAEAAAGYTAAVGASAGWHCAEAAAV